MFINLRWYIYNFAYKENKLLFFICLIIGLLAAIFASVGVGLLVPTISYLINEIPNSYFYEILIYFIKILSIEFNIFNSLLIASIIIFLGDFLAYLSMIISSHLTKKSLIESRSTLFRKILYNDFLNIIENKSGKISSIVNEQVSLSSEIVESFFRLSLNLLFALFLTAALFVISLKLTLISIVLGLFVLVSQHKIYSLFRKYWSDWQNNKILLTEYYSDLINSIKFIKQSGKEENKEKELKKMSKNEGNAIFYAFIFKYLSPFYTKGLATWLVFAIVIIGLEFFNSTGSQILIFLIIIRKLQSSVNQINLAFIDISKSSTNVSIIKKYFDTSKEVQISFGDKKFTFNKNIQFDNLNFKFKKSKILDNLSIQIKKNSFISIVGSSGSGKTTLFNIFSRIIEENSGSINIDDINIKKFIKKEFFKNISFVSQDSYVFNDTIRNNICNNNKYEKDKFEKILDITNSNEFISLLENKEDTVIGEKGLKISGGQLQRIVLCRALYMSPSIIFLDEATSALDPQTEENVLFRIKNEIPNLTLINIAHRLSSLKYSDRIYLLKNGKIMYKGSFEDILVNSKDFRDLFKIND